MSTLTLDTKNNNSITLETRNVAGSLSTDRKYTGYNYLLLESGDYLLLENGERIILEDSPGAMLTGDNRNTTGTATLDNKVQSVYLWSATTYPWAEQFPWLINGSGLILTKDTRN